MAMEDGNEDQLRLRAVYLGLLVYGDQQVRRVVTILTEVIKHHQPEEVETKTFTQFNHKGIY